MSALDEARREAHEALASKAHCTAMNCITCEPRLLHAIDALLAATAALPESPETPAPASDAIEYPCGCYAPDGDVCWRHAEPSTHALRKVEVKP